MARDILGEYGRDTSQPQVARASNGGQMTPKDVMNYKPPQGPRNIMDPKSPGLHGRNDGNVNRPQGAQSSGSPGIGGTNHGCCGSQGRY